MMGLSPGERSKRLMVLKRLTQGRKVMTSYITAVAAANAISALSVSVSFILPVSGKWCLAFQGFCKLFSRMSKLVFRALSQVLV